MKKPLGPSVNTGHHLLKNHIAESTAWKGYALLTKECLDAIGIHPNGTHSKVEHYEHLGEIETFSFDLQSRYEELKTDQYIITWWKLIAHRFASC